MTTLREAAQQALEALEAHADFGIKADRAITALRAALEKDAIKQQQEGERNMKNIELARRMVCEAAVYCRSDNEAIRIEYSGEDDYFQGVGEETGETYRVYFEEVDIDYDLFYKLVPMNPADLDG